MRTILIPAVLVMGCGSNAERAAARDAKAKDDAAKQAVDAAAKSKAEANAKADAIKNDASRLEGKWELTSANSDGRD